MTIVGEHDQVRREKKLKHIPCHIMEYYYYYFSMWILLSDVAKYSLTNLRKFATSQPWFVLR
jgi:hypothetical protein